MVPMVLGPKTYPIKGLEGRGSGQHPAGHLSPSCTPLPRRMCPTSQDSTLIVHQLNQEDITPWFSSRSIFSVEWSVHVVREAGGEEQSLVLR